MNENGKLQRRLMFDIDLPVYGNIVTSQGGELQNVTIECEMRTALRVVTMRISLLPIQQDVARAEPLDQLSTVNLVRIESVQS